MNPVVRSILAVVIGMLVAFPGSVAQAAGTIPDAGTLAELRRDAEQGHGVRVIGTFGQREIAHPLLDSTGVRSAAEAGGRQALFVTPDAPLPAEPAPLSWSEITEIKTRQQHKLRGALIGAGVALGLTAIALGSAEGEEAGAGGALVAAPLLGAAVGTFIGSLIGSKTIYRAQEKP